MLKDQKPKGRDRESFIEIGLIENFLQLMQNL